MKPVCIIRSIATVTDKQTSGVQDADAIKAAFLLELGLRSMLGGNGIAAQERLEACRRLLLAARDSRGSSPELRAQLGAVCGAQVSQQR